MKNLITIAILFLLMSFSAQSQQITWKENSEKTYVFEINNKEALKLLKSSPKDSLIKKMLHTPVASFSETWENQPTKGHFIFADIQKNRVGFNYVPVIPFQVFLFREYGALTIQVIDSAGNISENAKVNLNLTSINFDKESRTYTFDDYWSDEPTRILSVEVDEFKAYFDLKKYPVPSWHGSYNDSPSSPNFYSYMITDKNKYKPGEIVRFKAYALSGSKRPIKNELEVWMRTSNSYNSLKKITTISPYHPGGFAGEFQLHDSLELKLDKSYSFQLQDKKGRIVASTNFKYEDYALYDNHFEVKLQTPCHYSPNTNQLEIKAVDANGLFLKDVKADIIVKRKTVLNSYSDILQLPDTLIYRQLDLNNDAVTTFEIPDTIFEKSDCRYSIEVIATTFENQRMEYKNEAMFYFSHRDIIQSIANDSMIYFSFQELEKERSMDAILSYNNDKETKKIHLPYQEKFVQSTRSYSIQIPEVGYNEVFQTIKMNPELEILGGIQKDSFNIQLKNPLRLDVSWYVYQGNTLLKKGSGKDWDFRYGNVDLETVLYVEVFYFMGNEEQVFKKTFVPETDFLSVDLNLPERVYPGQKTDATVSVKNHWGIPVANVDLTAFSVNSLLKYDIPDLPYYGSDPVTRERQVNYDLSKKTYAYSLPLDFPFWNRIAQLDQLEYYQFTYPRGKLFTYTVNTPDSSTQFAPFVMKDGNAVNIYVIECDDVPVYFSWTEQPKGYSFIVPNKKQKITLRLSDRAIVLDSIQFESGKKSIFSVDLDYLPKNATVIKLNQYTFTGEEATRYQKYISRIPVLSPQTVTSITQKGLIYPVFAPCLMKYKESVLIGPVPPLPTKYNDGIEYKHEGGFSYKFDGNVVYKYPDQVYPGHLEFSTYNSLFKINDFYLTMDLFQKGLEECKRGKPWFPDNIFISLPNMTLNFRLPVEKDSSGVVNLLFEDCQSGNILHPNIIDKDRRIYSHIRPGTYNVIVLYNNGQYLKQKQVDFRLYTLSDINMSNLLVHPADSTSKSWLHFESYPKEIGMWRSTNQMISYRVPQKYGRNVEGYVIDELGGPVIGASVTIKGIRYGTITDLNGYFNLQVNNFYSTLVFSYLGYNRKEVEVYSNTQITVALEENIQMLDEVVVVGYGTQKKSSLTGAMMGLAAGVSRTKEEAELQVPLEKLENESTDKVEREAEEKLYNELMLLNGLRSNFSDVGFWEPRLFTDKQGKASFSVTFPDNITRWDAVVYAMNSKLKTGTARKYIKSYKPLMAELKTPSFLTVGDSSYFAGNIRNYTKDSLILGNVLFAIEQDTLMRKNIEFTSSHPNKMLVTADATDSLTTSYLFTRNDGYRDGEQRSIPIVELGAEIAEGSLNFLRNGDTVQIQAEPNETIHLNITDNQLDIYMDAANYLNGYKYACNEQLASKLMGLLDYKLYVQFKGEKFKNDKQVNEIIKRLLKNQNDKKLWSWWGRSSESSFWMSAHILRALKKAKDAGYSVNLNLQQIEVDYADIQPYRRMNLYDIDIIHALSEWGTKQNYTKILHLMDNMIQRYEFQEDSITKINKGHTPYSYLREKLLLLEIRQKQQIGYETGKISPYLKKDILGQIYCDDGRQERYWYGNKMANTLIAYRILRNDSNLLKLKEPVQMYILSTKHFDWNTYQASSAVSTILPDLIAENASKEKPATIILTGKENRTLSSFPYVAKLLQGESIRIEKKDGSPLLYSFYKLKRTFHANASDAFEIVSSFGVEKLTAGQAVRLVVNLKVKQKNAEHVMIEVPIPASCSYSSKLNYYGREVHREYFKEKTVIFCEQLPVGNYVFTIDLLPRFTGSYTLNPAKVELMYFPIIHANNDMLKIRVEE